METDGKAVRRTDEELVRFVIDGDEAAAQALFDRHRATLRRQVSRRLPTMLRRKVAESDIIQDAYLSAYLGLVRFEPRGEGSFRRWLATILDRRIKSELRRHIGTAKRNVGRELSVEAPTPIATDPSPSAAAMHGESEAQLAAAMGELPDDYRRVLRLVHDRELTLAEAAQEMGRSSEAVRKLYGRAVGRLADLMESE